MRIAILLILLLMAGLLAGLSAITANLADDVAAMNAVTNEKVDEIDRVLRVIDRNFDHIHNFDLWQVHNSEMSACLKGQHPLCRKPTPQLKDLQNDHNRQGNTEELHIQADDRRH